MELESKAELPATAYQLAEQYHIGRPLALHNMRPGWIRFCRVVVKVLPGIVICTVLFVLVLIALFLYQVIKGQVHDVQMRLLLGLPGIIVGLLGCVAFLIIRSMIVRKFPASLLVCTEGMLLMRSQGVDVIHWSEVRWILQLPGLGRRKHYQLVCIDRRSLHFDVFENMEDMVNIVRQQIQKKKVSLVKQGPP